MIALPLVLVIACAGPDPAGKGPGAPAPELTPAEGPWTLAWAEEYGGDCALDDMDTRQPASVEWALELESNGFTFYDETGYPVGCDLVAGSFDCSLGTYSVGYTDSGLDAVETITTEILGTFLSETAMEAIYAIRAACQGADCGLVGESYGRDFTYPCSAEAGIVGEWAG